MKKSNGITLHLGYISIITLLLLVVIYLKIHYHKTTAINVEPALLYKIIQPGSYVGKSNYGATDLYTNGLLCEHHIKITKIDDGLDVINNITAYDAVTNKLEYTCVRKILFIYKPNHDDNLFKISNSYIDGKLVSSSYGYASGKTSNSISFNLSGTWHISSNDYNNIYNTITRTDANTIDGVFKHYNMFGFTNLSLDEKYTMIV